MAVSGRNKKRNRKRSAEELARIKDATRRAALGAAEIALFALPGGAIVRLAKTGGKFAPGALAALKRRFSGAKEIKNPSKSQIDRAKPPSSVKPTTATGGGQQSGRVTVTDKQKSSGSTPKLEQKPTVVPKPRTSVTTRPSSTTKPTPKPRNRADDMKRANVTSDKPAARPTPKPKPTPKPNRSNVAAAGAGLKKAGEIKKAARAARRAKIIGGGATGAGVAVLASKALKDQKPTQAEEPKRSTKPKGPRTSPEITPPKKSAPRTTPDTSTDRGARKPKRKGPLVVGPRRTSPDTFSEKGRKGTPKRTPVVTAGKNTGFGPKGNIFPGSAAERAALMKMYGGTGSAAAKAAAAGKQGDLKAGKAAYEKAKKDRRKKSS